MQIVKMVAAIPSVVMVSRVPVVLSSSSLLPFHFAVGSKLTLQRSKNQNKHLLNCIYQNSYLSKNIRTFEISRFSRAPELLRQTLNFGLQSIYANPGTKLIDNSNPFNSAILGLMVLSRIWYRTRLGIPDNHGELKKYLEN